MKNLVSFSRSNPVDELGTASSGVSTFCWPIGLFLLCDIFYCLEMLAPFESPSQLFLMGNSFKIPLLYCILVRNARGIYVTTKLQKSSNFSKFFFAF